MTIRVVLCMKSNAHVVRGERMKHLFLLLCFLFVACDGKVEVNPEPATDMNLRMFEDQITSNYTVREVFQVPLGEGYENIVDNGVRFEADGVVIGALVDSPRAEGVPVLMYRDPNDGRIIFLNTKRYAGGGLKSATSDQFKSARALWLFLIEQR